MRGLTLAGQSENAEPSGTKIGQFLANTGVIIIKEVKEIGTLSCDYGAKIKAQTMILRTARSSTRFDDKTYGIKLELLKNGEMLDSAVLDFDESEEFCNAIQFISEAAQKVANQRTDYIETIFSTKDHITIGFYQSTDQHQQAFVTLSRHGDTCFLTIQSIPAFLQLVVKARDHLVKKGAGQ
jgi:hypothetical protein